MDSVALEAMRPMPIAEAIAAMPAPMPAPA
jgi:hypothetical protein